MFQRCAWKWLQCHWVMRDVESQQRQCQELFGYRLQTADFQTVWRWKSACFGGRIDLTVSDNTWVLRQIQCTCVYSLYAHLKTKIHAINADRALCSTEAAPLTYIHTLHLTPGMDASCLCYLLYTFSAAVFTSCSPLGLLRRCKSTWKSTWFEVVLMTLSVNLLPCWLPSDIHYKHLGWEKAGRCIATVTKGERPATGQGHSVVILRLRVRAQFESEGCCAKRLPVL